MSQQGKITHANGEWALSNEPSEQTQEAYAKVLDTCPSEWEYLNRIGSDGWELVAVNSSLVKGEMVPGFFSADEIEFSGNRVLYLKRASKI